MTYTVIYLQGYLKPIQHKKPKEKKKKKEKQVISYNAFNNTVTTLCIRQSETLKDNITYLFDNNTKGASFSATKINKNNVLFVHQS